MSEIKFVLGETYDADNSPELSDEDKAYWKAIKSRRRNQCPWCGRFVKNTAMHSTYDYVEGLHVRWSCSKCGDNLRDTL